MFSVIGFVPFFWDSAGGTKVLVLLLTNHILIFTHFVSVSARMYSSLTNDKQNLIH